MIDAQTISAITGASADRAREFAPHIAAAMAKHGIVTPIRQAAFLAQVGHESGGLKYTREIWGPTPAQARYEGRKDLGNTQLGDGRRFLGRGLIQVTGRANYVRVGQKLGVDLVAAPERLEQPDLACMSAALWWADNGCNELADKCAAGGDAAFAALTRRINGGTNGLEDRSAKFAKARKALSC